MAFLESVDNKEDGVRRAALRGKCSKRGGGRAAWETDRGRLVDRRRKESFNFTSDASR